MGTKNKTKFFIMKVLLKICNSVFIDVSMVRHTSKVKKAPKTRQQNGFGSKCVT